MLDWNGVVDCGDGMVDNGGNMVYNRCVLLLMMDFVADVGLGGGCVAMAVRV